MKMKQVFFKYFCFKKANMMKNTCALYKKSRTIQAHYEYYSPYVRGVVQYHLLIFPYLK